MTLPNGTVVKDESGRTGKVVTYHMTIDQYEVNFFMSPHELQLVPIDEPQEQGTYAVVLLENKITYTRKTGYCWFNFGDEECHTWPPFENIIECRKID